MLTFFLSFDLYNCVQKLFSLLVGIKKYFIYCTSLNLSKCLTYESSRESSRESRYVILGLDLAAEAGVDKGLRNSHSIKS